MHLMYQLDAEGKRVYTLTVSFSAWRIHKVQEMSGFIGFATAEDNVYNLTGRLLSLHYQNTEGE